MEAARRVPLDFYTSITRSFLSARCCPDNARTLLLPSSLLLAYSGCLDLPSMIRARNAGHYQASAHLFRANGVMEPCVISMNKQA